MRSTKHLLSLIIPVYKQEETIIANLEKICSVLDTIQYQYELIAVVDGFVDNSYQKIVAAKIPGVKVVGYQHNQGKFYAIRHGMLQAKGDYVMFIDAGMEIHPNGISMLLQHMEWYEADIIVGSKRHQASQVTYNWQRKLLSYGYYYLVKLLFNISVTDTQAGIKVFKKPVLAKLLPILLEQRFAGDLEILVLANQLGYHRIYEAPIKLDYTLGGLSNAATLKQIWNILVDTFGLFYRLNFSSVYQKRLDFHQLETYLRLREQTKPGSTVERKPLVSVLMPAYNAELFVEEAIESILKQTYKPFELLILNDASTDNTLATIKKYSTHKQVKIFNTTKRKDIYQARNFLIKQAAGEFIAWQDADDISQPDRLELQIKAMTENPLLGIIGGYLQIFDEKGNQSTRRYAEDDDALRQTIFRFSPVAQPAAMIRRQVFDYVGYYTSISPAEDLDMSFRIGKYFRFSNIQKVILKYRDNHSSSTYKRHTQMELNTIRIRFRNMFSGDYSFSILDVIYNCAQLLSLFFMPTSVRLQLFKWFRDQR